jgi:hypothetical protein
LGDCCWVLEFGEEQGARLSFSMAADASISCEISGHAAVGDVQLGEDGGDVVTDCLGCDLEPCCDCRHVVVVDEGFENFEFARGERRERRWLCGVTLLQQIQHA